MANERPTEAQRRDPWEQDFQRAWDQLTVEQQAERCTRKEIVWKDCKHVYMDEHISKCYFRKKNYSCLCPDPEKQPKVTEHHEEPDEKKKVTGYCPTLGCRYKGESKVEDACPAWAMPKKEQKAEPDLSKMNGFDKLR